MKVECQANQGDALPDSYFDRGYSRASRFDLKLGNHYSVYGICLHLGDILYLLLGEGQRPGWYPAELFEVIDGKLHSSWHYTFLGFESELNAIWGYNELVNDSEYFDQLSNLEDPALIIFEKRRMELPKFRMIKALPQQ